MKHYEYEINLFSDGELPPHDYKELFVHLAECDECKKSLADYLLLKEKSKEFCSKNISFLMNKPAKQNMFYKVGFYTSVAAAVLLLFMLFTNKPIQTYNAMNGARVDTVFIQKEVPSTQNQNVKNNSLTPGKKELRKETSQQAYLNYMMSLRTVKITDADVIKTRNGS